MFVRTWFAFHGDHLLQCAAAGNDDRSPVPGSAFLMPLPAVESGFAGSAAVVFLGHLRRLTVLDLIYLLTVRSGSDITGVCTVADAVLVIWLFERTRRCVHDVR